MTRLNSGQVPGVLMKLFRALPKSLQFPAPFCLTMMSDGLAASDSHVQVRDISELLFEALG